MRKMRWRVEGRGKRGDLRIVYYWNTPYDIIYMLLLYKK